MGEPACLPDFSDIKVLHEHNMHYAYREVKSKCISIECKLHSMTFDDRPEFAKRLEQARKARGFKTAKDAARRFGWTYETYIQHEQGIRGISRAAKKYADAFRVSEAWLLTGEGDSQKSGAVTSQEEIVAFLRRIEGLPESAIETILGVIEIAKKNQDGSKPSVDRDEHQPEKAPHAVPPSRQR